MPSLSISAANAAEPIFAVPSSQPRGRAQGSGTETEPTEAEPLLQILEETTGAFDDVRVPYALIGGVASTTWGRPRTTKDIDVLVRPGDAELALLSLETRGFEVERTDPRWIFKAYKLGIQIDIIFATRIGIYLDDEFNDHCQIGSFQGRRVRLAAPEDVVIIKAIAHDEATPRHWHDALGIIAARELDWDYLLHRSRKGQRRLLSLLLYAQSIDYAVPNRVIRILADRICEC